MDINLDTLLNYCMDSNIEIEDIQPETIAVEIEDPDLLQDLLNYKEIVIDS